MKFFNWCARLALIAVLAFGTYAVLDPLHRFAQVPLRGDRYLHGALSYAITLTLIAAFPRLSALRLALGVMCLGGAIEVAQFFGYIGGDAEFGDLAVDCVGVLMAFGPFHLGRSRAAAAPDPTGGQTTPPHPFGADPASASRERDTV